MKSMLLGHVCVPNYGRRKDYRQTYLRRQHVKPSNCRGDDQAKRFSGVFLPLGLIMNIVAYTYPFNTAASALRMEEPAAPITAMEE